MVFPCPSTYITYLSIVGTAPPPTRNDLEVVNANPVTTSAFTRVSNSVIGVVPTTASLGNNGTQFTYFQNF